MFFFKKDPRNFCDSGALRNEPTTERGARRVVSAPYTRASRTTALKRCRLIAALEACLSLFRNETKYYWFVIAPPLPGWTQEGHRNDHWPPAFSTIPIGR
jgi:hypothetical protein